MTSLWRPVVWSFLFHGCQSVTYWLKKWDRDGKGSRVTEFLIFLFKEISLEDPVSPHLLNSYLLDQHHSQWLKIRRLLHSEPIIESHEEFPISKYLLFQSRRTWNVAAIQSNTISHRIDRWSLAIAGKHLVFFARIRCLFFMFFVICGPFIWSVNKQFCLGTTVVSFSDCGSSLKLPTSSLLRDGSNGSIQCYRYSSLQTDERFSPRRSSLFAGRASRCSMGKLLTFKNKRSAS